MRKQYFINYLKSYLNDVSGLKTANIHKLVLASKKNLRIRDCLILYCGLSSRQQLLNRFTNNKYKDVLDRLNEDNYLSDEFSDYEFRKIQNSYENKIKVMEYDDITKLKVHDNTINLMNKKGLTNYRIYKDLGLNPGNVNDYLTNKNIKKVSVDTALKIFEYAYAY